ncbi:carbamoyltransferase family protein [Haloarcula halophila]|uniref:carbamoyltransferase family protein n=1 Tax=Haloarcula TaxID=2237 RepID=UPI0023E43D1D|nr:carbamoyltransferase C-terminal domain-containing protein [Halomicroarcula sp. DFY41]
MWILGIKPSLGKLSPFNYWGYHDGGACLLRDDKILAIAEEERFTRDKHANHTFPTESIRYVLREAGLKLDAIDVVAIGRDPRLQKNATFEEYKERKSPPTSLRDLYDLATAGESALAAYGNVHIREVASRLADLADGTFDVEYLTVPHHRCHAASAAYCASEPEPVTLTIDGRAEYESTVLWDENLNRIETIPHTNSVGKLYSLGAKYLGFRGRVDAGKVMGLSSYGSHRESFETAFEEFVEVGEGTYNVSTVTRSEDPVALLESYFGERSRYGEPFEPHHQDFAHHLQIATEQIVVELARSLTVQTGNHDLAIAGGVALNCKANRALKDATFVDSLFAQPAANDAGVCLGAALDAYRQVTGEAPDPTFDGVYFGPSYGNEEIEQLLENTKLESKRFEDICSETARYLADGYLVGWFQGRMEYGPRALGNRSILADPRDEDSLDLVNANVKNREKWRPFAPSLLAERRDEYLESGDESGYMIVLDRISETKQDEVPAIVHVDGTCRPQTVKEETNPRYHRLLREFESITGTPVLLNTSFNVAGEPIVESPEQALRDFYSTGLDVLVLEEYLVTKPHVTL